MKKVKLIVLTSLLSLGLMVGSIAIAEEQVVPGSVKRDIVLRLSTRFTRNYVNYYLAYRRPNFKDRVELYQEKGDAQAVMEAMGFLGDMLFEYTHPRIKLEYSSFESSEEAELMAAIAAGTVPSLMDIDPKNVYRYAKEGILADITDYVKTWNRYKYIPKAAWDLGTVNGRIYAFPGSQEFNYGFVYRKDYFKEAGIFNKAGESAPPDDWTVEDFIKVCSKIAGTKKGRYGFGVSAKTCWHTPPVNNLMDVFGGMAVNPDPTGKYTWQVDFDNNPAKRYYDWFARLLKSGGVLYGANIDSWARNRSGELAMWDALPVLYPAGWIMAKGVHSNYAYPKGVELGRDIGGCKYPAGPEGVQRSCNEWIMGGVMGSQTKEQIAASMELVRWWQDEDPNPAMALQTVVWWAGTLSNVNVPVVDRVNYQVINRPQVDMYKHYIKAPGIPTNWTEIPGIKQFIDYLPVLRAVPSKPLSNSYGANIPFGSIQNKLQVVDSLLISNPNADWETELAREEKLINSTILNYKDKDVTKENIKAYYTALANFYKKNYPEYYNKYFTKLLEERYKIW